jgi:hypothetical protein
VSKQPKHNIKFVRFKNDVSLIHTGVLHKIRSTPLRHPPPLPPSLRHYDNFSLIHTPPPPPPFAIPFTISNSS